MSQGASHCSYSGEDLTFIFQRRWLVGWKNIVDEFELKTSELIFKGGFEWKLIHGTKSECLFS